METGTINSNNKIIKKLFVNAFIIMGMMELMMTMASMIDSYYIGNYVGSMGMAASGFARPFFSFVNIISGLLGLGIQLLCSHYIGKGSLDNAQKAFSGALFIGLVSSAILASVGFFNSRAIASIYGRGEAVADILILSEDYLKGLFLGAPAMIIFGILSPIVQIGNGKKMITVSVVLQFAVDIAGDALNAYAFDSSMFGFGIATSAAYYVSLVPLVVYFLRSDAILKLRLSLLPPGDFKEIFRSGWSKAIKRICSTLKPIALNGLSLLLGMSLALSAYSITNQVRDVLVSFCAGATGAAVLIGALLYGQRDRDGLKCLSSLAIRAVGVAAALGAVCIVCARPIADFFISDSEDVIRMATLSIRCVGIMIPFSVFNSMFISFMQITKRYRLVNALSYLNRLILIVLTSALLGFLFGTNGLWWALPISEIVNAVITLLTAAKLNGSFPRKVVDLLCLPEDFGFKKEDYIEISVNCAEDVVALQDTVKAFCASHGIESRRSYFTQLALEELAMNVIEHGFPKCRHTPSIHVWITYDDGDMKLRIQDNCPGFNVMKHCGELQQESRERCVGLRLVSKISKEMNYVNMLETNNLMITI